MGRLRQCALLGGALVPSFATRVERISKEGPQAHIAEERAIANGQPEWREFVHTRRMAQASSRSRRAAHRRGTPAASSGSGNPANPTGTAAEKESAEEEAQGEVPAPQGDSTGSEEVSTEEEGAQAPATQQAELPRTHARGPTAQSLAQGEQPAVNRIRAAAAAARERQVQAKTPKPRGRPPKRKDPLESKTLEEFFSPRDPQAPSQEQPPSDEPAEPKQQREEPSACPEAEAKSGSAPAAEPGEQAKRDARPPSTTPVAHRTRHAAGTKEAEVAGSTEATLMEGSKPEGDATSPLS